METYKKAYEYICRLCLRHDKSAQMVSLVEDGGLSCYGQYIVTFAKVLDEKSDRYPNKMCQKCLSILEQAISFKNQCETSERRLKNISDSCSSTEATIQEIVECSLFLQHFPDKTDTESQENSCSSTTELNAMEEMLNLLEVSDNCDIAVDSIDNDSSNDDESKFLLDLTQNTQIKTVEVHKKRKDGSINIYCHICKRIYNNQSSLLTHMKKHNLSIEKDPDLFMDIMQSYLKDKIESKAPETDSLLCKICNKTFSSKSVRLAHMKRHSVGSFVCEQCGKAYPTQPELQVHLLCTHNSGPGLKCDYCDHKSINHFHLKEHIRLHTGERPFTCEKCGLTFRRQYIYRKHLLLHGERSIKCPDCPRKFFRKGDMLLHRNNVHERLYMYVCSKCGATYAKNTTVRKHLTKHHGIPRELQGKIAKILSKNSTPSCSY